MTAARPNILLACNENVRNNYLPPTQIARLEALADWCWFPCEGGGIYDTNSNPEVAQALRMQLADVDGLILCHGAPTITDDLLVAAPKLRIIGELEGDRFASRIDLDAAWARGIRTVDTTNASSYPVAEWALGLILSATRNAATQFRQIIDGDGGWHRDELHRAPGMLTGKRVGLIGCGHMGRRLLELLRPFQVDVWVYDPYLPREMAEALGFVQTSLENVMGQCQVIVCLAPLTPATRGLVGQSELALMRPRSVIVNVSRGPVVDSAALVERLRRGDIFAGLDVFDPEPIPADHPITQLPNVFLTPHIGWYSGDPYPHFFKLMVDELERFFAGHETWYDLTPRSQANRHGKGAGNI
ncbi:MAG: hydroxyacid dehydrogenase [Caldilineaceae bacterium]